MVEEKSRADILTTDILDNKLLHNFQIKSPYKKCKI